MKKEITYRDLGLVRYGECWAMQEQIFNSLIAAKQMFRAEKKETDDADPRQTLLLCEHPHVYTLGKSGNSSNLLITEDFVAKIGAEYYKIDRGGDITYHGPGQLVGYPILDLEVQGLGLKEYIHLLEQTIIDTIADFGIKGGRMEGATGVWLEGDGIRAPRKISAIGVRSSRFVTMHGFALNVDPVMEYFSYINPCGFTDKGVTSMSAETGERIDMKDVKNAFTNHFAANFAPLCI